MKRRFTIRGLLILTFLVALLLAFPFRTARMQRQGRDWVALQRGHVSFRHDMDRTTGRYAIPWVPELLVHWLGVDMFNPVRWVMLDCETIEELGPLSNLTSLESFVVNIEMADDIDFSPLQKLPNLKEIHFTEWSALTRPQLKQLQQMLPNVKIYSEFDTPDQ